MKETKKLSILVLALVLVSMLRGCSDEPTVTVVEHTDTIRVDNPAVIETVYVDKPRVVKIPVEKIKYVGDSVYIEDVVEKHYHDSLYDAWISGVDPKLDSIHVYRKTITKTITKSVPKYIVAPEKPIRFNGFVSGQTSFDINHVNLQAGAELNYKNFGIKAGYNIGDYNYPFVGVEYKIR